MNVLQKVVEKAKNAGYSKQVCDFLSKMITDLVCDAVEAVIDKGGTDREVIEACLSPSADGGVYRSEKEFEEEAKSCIEGGKQNYLEHCDKDGRFRYEDFGIK